MERFIIVRLVFLLSTITIPESTAELKMKRVGWQLEMLVF